jgi:methionyl-tRNA synthetase
MLGDSKMSKSLGNVVSPLDLVDQYGVDAVRYYLMSQMVMGMDCNFTLESFIKRFNNDLANDFGNLLNRVSGLINKYFDGIVPEPGELTQEDLAIKNLSSSVNDRIKDSIERFEVQSAIAAIIELVSMTNKYMESQAPWKVAKDNKQRAGTILYVATEALRIAAVQLSPVMPQKTNTLLDIISAVGSSAIWGGLKVGTKLKFHEALFPRLEMPTE